MLDSSAHIKEAGRKKSERSEQDLALWDKWRKSEENPEYLRPLLSNFRGLIRSRSRVWENVDLPPAAINAEFQQRALDAFRSYDPDKGANLATWVTTNLKKAPRWVVTYQNPARIVEKRSYDIGVYQNAKASLDDQLGREPTTHELSDNLGWAEAEVSRMESELRGALPSSGFGEGFDPTTIMPSRSMEKLQLLRYELTPAELQVYEYTLGLSGKPLLKPGQIAKKLGYSAPKVTRLRNAIIKKYKKYED